MPSAQKAETPVSKELYDEALLSEKMRSLADKAYKLSLKYDLSDEAKLI